MISYWRHFILLLLSVTLMGCFRGGPASALSEQQELVDKSRITFEKLISSPDFTELPSYIRSAKAVIIFPSLVRGGFLIGAEGGSGLLLVRSRNGGWTDPAFYTMASGSIGLQAGGQVAEVIFTIMSDEALYALLNDQFKFGGDISVAAGPLGKGVGTGSATNLRADVYSFAKTVGLYGGLSFDGTGMFAREDWNTGYYGPGATPYSILIEQRYTNPNTMALRRVMAPY